MSTVIHTVTERMESTTHPSTTHPSAAVATPPPAFLDEESRVGLRDLRSEGRTKDQAVARLHALLLRAARFECARRRPALPHLRGNDLDDIAAVLNSVNPKHWELATMKAEMHKHLDLTTQEAVARLQGNWSADVAAYDQIHEHILHMSDLLSSGLVKQFPKRFR